VTGASWRERDFNSEILSLPLHHRLNFDPCVGHKSNCNCLFVFCAELEVGGGGPINIRLPNVYYTIITMISMKIAPWNNFKFKVQVKTKLRSIPVQKLNL
jgi:hypothetical protein